MYANYFFIKYPNCDGVNVMILFNNNSALE